MLISIHSACSYRPWYRPRSAGVSALHISLTRFPVRPAMFRRRWPIAAAAGPDALAAAYRSYCEASCFCFDHAWSGRWAASAVGRRLELRDRTECTRSSFDFARFRADSSGGSGSSCWGKAGVRGLCIQRVCRGRVPAKGLGAKSPRSCGINAHTHTHTPV